MKIGLHQNIVAKINKICNNINRTFAKKGFGFMTQKGANKFI